MKKYGSVCIAYILLSLVPGCGRVINWGKQSFDQGKLIDDTTQRVQHALRSTAVYDQLTTAGKFDAIWLSDAVRSAYVDMYGRRMGKNEQQKKQMLRRQLEENAHYHSFIVLSLHEMPLGEPSSQWGVFLQVGDQTIHPIEVKVIELLPEYEYFFGPRYSRFKVPYSVKFDAHNIDGSSVVSSDTKQISLQFMSARKHAALVWDITPASKALYDDNLLAVKG